MGTQTTKPPSEEQIKARKRAWQIFRLRGLHAQAYMLTGSYRVAALNAIDMELQSMGAETESARQQALREKYS